MDGTMQYDTGAKALERPMVGKTDAPPVAEATKYLADRVERLDLVISELVDRLEPILRAADEDSPGAPRPEFGQSQVANNIAINGGRIDYLGDRLGAVVRRLEV